MATYTEAQKRDIIFNNPNKALVDKAKDMRKLYSKHTHGVGYRESLHRDEYTEDIGCYGARKKGAISNRDLFKRLLNREDQVFTTAGGSAFYQLSKADEDKMNAVTDDVIYGLSLHKWVHTYALPAYRADPMGVIFMEAQEVISADGENFPVPKCYPTYKSSDDIFDYLPNGRKLEHICFVVTKEQLKAYGIIENLPDNAVMQFATGSNNLGYFRFVDDETDTIYKRENDQLTTVSMRQRNPIYHDFSSVPAFIISDLFQYDDPQCFGSPLQFVIEIADAFLQDRSVRDLHKKLHGFPKVVEPLVKCQTCKTANGDSTGLKGGHACPDCTVAGQSIGSGFKQKTTPADVMRFPLEILKDAHGFDIKKIFAYITPDVEGLNMMNQGLVDQEELMQATYWGTKPIRVQGFNGKQDINETATKTLTDLQPIYARLNMTADWGESTIKMIADMMGRFLFGDSWKGANIALSRNYVLELPEDILLTYHDMLKASTPDATLDAQFKRYLMAVWKSNPDKLAVEIKLFDLQPFPHKLDTEIEASTIIPMADKVASRYYGEWVNSLTEQEKQQKNKAQLLESFKAYTKDKVAAVTLQQAAELKTQIALKAPTAPPKTKTKKAA